MKYGWIKHLLRKNSAGADFGPRRRINVIEGANITLTVADDADNDEIDLTIAAASDAPTNADYLVGTANASLSNEIVVGTVPGGELGGTWATPTVDATHSGSAHHAAVTIGADVEHSLVGQVISGVDAAAAQKGHIQLAGELGGTAASPTVAATHSGSAHHTRAHAMDGSSDHSAGTLGGMIYAGVAGAITWLAGNSTTTKKFLRQTGTGAASAAPAWDTVADADVGFTDVTTGNASTSAHGFLPKLDNVATNFLNGQGAWAVPTGGGGTQKAILNYSMEAYNTSRYAAFLSGSGANAVDTGGIRGNTGATDGSQAGMSAKTPNVATFGVGFDRNPELHGLVKFSNNTATAFVSSLLFALNPFASVPGNDASLTQEHFGFILDTTVLYASNASGTTQTKTDISSGVTVTDALTLKAIMDSGTDIKFYVDGTLKATHATNLPSGGFNDDSYLWTFLIDNDTGVTTDRSMHVGGVTILID